MKNEITLLKVNGQPSILHGGDYNPDQWLDHPEILDADIRMMQKAHINSATLGVFAWASYEPKEGQYNFSWLTDIMGRLYQAGIYTVLATPSGARPAWLDAAYPEVRRVSKDGVRAQHGWRHNHCMSSPIFREKATALDTALAQAVKGHPGLILWHISNELGGECYCPLCCARFQNWLRVRYHNSIKELNNAWWANFWSHTYSDFSQVEPPFAHGEGSIPGLKLDWRRFTTWNMADCMQEEIDAVRAVTPDIPVTTNFMQFYDGLDYHEMAPRLDIISWDSYPKWHNDYEPITTTAAHVAFDHAVMRGCGDGKPFLLMETAPGFVSWQPYNKLHRPGLHALNGLQAIACGADSVQYFQWRQARGAHEQYHGAVVGHLGTDDTRIFRETADLGVELEKLREVTGSHVAAQAAMLVDWDSRWAVADAQAFSENRSYEETCIQQYRVFAKHGVELDVISSKSDFSRYKLLVLPMLYLLHPGVAERLRAFAAQGGVVLATYITGYVDESTLCYLGGTPGDGLSDVFGVKVEELDSLYPTDANAIRFADTRQTAALHDFAEVLRVAQDEGTEVLARYTDDFYKDTPALTRKGGAYYLAARLEDAGLEEVCTRVWRAAGITPQTLPQGVEYHCRADEAQTRRWHFYLNFSDSTQTLTPPAGSTELLRGTTTALLAPWDVAVYLEDLPIS